MPFPSEICKESNKIGRYVYKKSEMAYQVTPINPVADMHENVPVPVIQTECHVSVEQIVDVIWFSFLILQNRPIHQVRSANEGNVPKTPVPNNQNNFQWTKNNIL